jgi:hypothetical protein
MKRKLLVLALGVGFLLVITGLGTFITNYFPTHPTSQVQTTQAGAYTVTLSVNPNPPPTDKQTTLTVQIQQTASHKAINGLQVTLDGTVQGDMGGEIGGSTSTQALAQGSGTYIAQVSLGMSGSWQIQVLISQPGQPALNTVFTVTTQ